MPSRQVYYIVTIATSLKIGRIQARIQRGAAHPPAKKQSEKNPEKRMEKMYKIKKINENCHNTVNKWVKSEEFSRG